MELNNQLQSGVLRTIHQQNERYVYPNSVNQCFSLIMRMILQIIISNGILDLVTGIWQKLAWELGFGTPLHDPHKCHQNPTVENRKAYPWLHTFWSSYASYQLD